MLFSKLNRRYALDHTWLKALAIASALQLMLLGSDVQASGVFESEKFTQDDAILVSDETGGIVFQWQADKLLIPASLNKLVTAYIALDKWGEKYRFATDFYVVGDQLWVKGYGDPFLTSEEIEIMARILQQKLPSKLASIHVDASYFALEPVPGRTAVSDPYNAPLSAVAANFNTVKLQRTNGVLHSGEPQTPLTATAIEIAAMPGNALGGKANRLNLVSVDRAQKHFAEILLAKLSGIASQSSIEVDSIKINQSLPNNAQLVYRHLNSHSLVQVLRGTLEFSNNFIANQIYLLFAENEGSNVMTFADAGDYLSAKIRANLVWAEGAKIYEGAGLSRKNSLSATQLNQVLQELVDSRTLLKKYSLKNTAARMGDNIIAYAKSGTLDGVHNLAGYLEVAERRYQFVFMFNRTMPYGYREKLLQKLANQLSQQLKG